MLHMDQIQAGVGMTKLKGATIAAALRLRLMNIEKMSFKQASAVTEKAIRVYQSRVSKD